MTFETLGLSPALLRALAELGYTTPTPIQAEAIPLVLAGRDLLGGAQTGTGKTAAFALPLLQRLVQATAVRGPRKPRALILTPTRELAVQVARQPQDLRPRLRLQTSRPIYGGAGMQPQIDDLRRGVDILVATPGPPDRPPAARHASTSTQVEILVLDEADRMLDMGFLPAIKRVARPRCRTQRQTLLFSATFEDQIKALAHGVHARSERSAGHRAQHGRRDHRAHARIRSTARASATC